MYTICYHSRELRVICDIWSFNFNPNVPSLENSYYKIMHLIEDYTHAIGVLFFTQKAFKFSFLGSKMVGIVGQESQGFMYNVRHSVRVNRCVIVIPDEPHWIYIVLRGKREGKGLKNTNANQFGNGCQWKTYSNRESIGRCEGGFDFVGVTVACSARKFQGHEMKVGDGKL